MLKVGLVIADDSEFAPVVARAKQLGGSFFKFFGFDFVSFIIHSSGKQAEIIAVLCGIGKVNAANATTALCCKFDVDAIINFGLSGAISGVNKNDIVIGTGFFEHDFDLTALGYEIGEKPQPVSSYFPNKQLNDALSQSFSSIRPCVFVTGDSFVSSKQKKQFIIDKFNGGCCDMETAAIASVCHKIEKPFASIRLISDDADESAVEAYTNTNAIENDTLLNIATNSVNLLLKSGMF